MKKLVIVGSGPGLANTVAARFGREGWRVVMVARNRERLETEADELRGQGVDAVPVALDVTDVHALDSFIRRESEDGGIDLLNYNAALIRPNTPILETALDDIPSDIAIGLGGAIVAARAAIPGMQARGEGTVIFSGGQLAFSPWDAMVTLGACKAGMRNAAGALAMDPACADLKIAYVNIDAHIVGKVRDEIADYYWQIHHQPRADHQWDLNYAHPY